MMVPYASDELALAGKLLSDPFQGVQPDELGVKETWSGTLKIQEIKVAALDCNVMPVGLVKMLQIHNLVAACAQVW